MTSARGQTPIERILLHVVQVLTVAGIIGGYVSLSDLQTSNAVLRTEIVNLSNRFEDLRAIAGDRYTASQAQRDLQPILQRLSDHETRIRRLEGNGG